VLLVSVFCFHALVSSGVWSPPSPFGLNTIPEETTVDFFGEALSVGDGLECFFYEEPGEDFGSDEDLLECCRTGNVRDIEIALAYGQLSSDQVTEALMEACFFGQIGAVERILQDPRVVPSFDKNACLRAAIEGNHLGVVGVLLEDGRLNLAEDSYHVVRLAYVNGRKKIVKRILGHRGTDLVAAMEALKPTISMLKRYGITLQTS
jgi:hypothetical protein